MYEKFEKRKGKSARLRIERQINASQNFLTSRRLLERIVKRSTITKNDTVIEIGTGKGHLTEVICRRANYVYSVEIDRRLFEHAKERLKRKHINNVKLICGDFRLYALPSRGDYKVFANIPYYMTTEIVKKLTEDAHPPSEIWLVMEKGAAKRFMGVSGETTYSLRLKNKWKLDIVYYFAREDFHPKPSVDSVLLHMSRLGNF